MISYILGLGVPGGPQPDYSLLLLPDRRQPHLSCLPGRYLGSLSMPPFLGTADAAYKMRDWLRPFQVAYAPSLVVGGCGRQGPDCQQRPGRIGLLISIVRQKFQRNVTSFQRVTATVDT